MLDGAAILALEPLEPARLLARAARSAARAASRSVASSASSTVEAASRAWSTASCAARSSVTTSDELRRQDALLLLRRRDLGLRAPRSAASTRAFSDRWISWPAADAASASAKASTRQATTEMSPSHGHEIRSRGRTSLPHRHRIGWGRSLALERLQRARGLASQRPDERSVVLVGDRSRPVVELELLERRRAPGRAPRAARGGAARPRRARRGRPTRARAPGGTGSATATTQPTASSAASTSAKRQRVAGSADLARALDEPPLLARVRPERDQRAEQEDEPRDPDEVDERLHEDAEVHACRRDRSARR